jgi:putative PIN family toxin of toxin-antitoxin system
LVKAVFDTHVIASAAMSPRGIPAALVQRWRAGEFEMVVSNQVLAEYQTALNYRKIRERHGRNQAWIAAFVERFREHGTFIVSELSVDIVTADPDDNIFVACAVQGDAEYIVSGDRQLLNLGGYQRIQILRPADFLAILET